MITLLEFLLKKHIENIQPSDAIYLCLPSGTLWCSHNVGANKPEDYGDYFAWGETEPKKEYYWSTYKWGKDCTKYNRDNKTLLDLEDDAAYVNMGGDWRIPTQELMQELIDETENKWTTLNEIKGRLFTGSNGNSIFIPAAGYRYGSSISGVGSYCHLWSSTLYYSGGYNYASYLYFYFGVVDPYSSIGRYYGLSVRGIINK